MHHRVDVDDLDGALDRAVALLRTAERVAVLTGAGVSAESGVATFRGAGGLWEGHGIEDVACPSAFRRDPTLVWRFYNARRTGLRKIQPNAAHYALVTLEDRLGSDHFALITQNVDGLHRAAGSRHVLEVHGSLARVRCTGCRLVEERQGEDLEDLPRCRQCDALLRPHVVWFNEMLPEDLWEEAVMAAQQCQGFLVVGTSAVVYPAAGLVDVARASRARVIEINLRATEVTHKVDVALHGPSGEILPQLLERLPK